MVRQRNPMAVAKWCFHGSRASAKIMRLLIIPSPKSGPSWRHFIETWYRADCHLAVGTRRRTNGGHTSKPQCFFLRLPMSEMPWLVGVVRIPYKFCMRRVFYLAMTMLQPESSSYAYGSACWTRTGPHGRSSLSLRSSYMVTSLSST